jgi:hypothetical protein
MAAPTNAATSQKVLTNSEPSTHGPSRHIAPPHDSGRERSEADINMTEPVAGGGANDPARTCAMARKHEFA